MPDAEVDWSAWIAEIERQAKAELRAYLAAKVRALPLNPPSGLLDLPGWAAALDASAALIEGSDPASRSWPGRAEMEAMTDAEVNDVLESRGLDVRVIEGSDPASPEVTTAWLIERGQSMGQVPPVWFAGTMRWGVLTGGEWTDDAFKAVRYPTREAAEAEIERRSGLPIPSHGGPEGSRVGIAVEHGFIEGSDPASPEADDSIEAIAEALERAIPAVYGDDAKSAWRDANALHRVGVRVLAESPVTESSRG